MPPLLSIDEALARVLARVRPLESEPVPVAEAAGRVLAEDVAAPIDLPPFPSSAMDGFAIRAADVPGELPVVFRIAAGRPAERALEAGEAMEISTGGTVPAGADTVVPIEIVVENDNSVQRAESGHRGSAHPADRGRCARRRCAARRRDRARRCSDRSARGSRDRRGLVQPPAQGGRSQHRHRAPHSRASRSARGRSTSRTARCSRPRSRPPARWSTGSALSPTTRRSTAVRSSGGSRPTFS